MSAIQLLEKIGANAALRHTKNELLSEQEITNLIDICPDVYCFMAPAEEEDDDSDDNDDDNDDDNGDDDGDDGDDGGDDGSDECNDDNNDHDPETKSVVNL